jgi:ABC-type phosphate transport system substrate-binding protein
MLRSRKSLALVPLVAAALLGLSAPGAWAQNAGPARGSDFTPVNGYGSSWAGPAIDEWAEKVHSQGIVINFDPDGSAAGRQQYMLDQADFAASDIPFLTTPDPFGGGTENPTYAFSYIPIVAGGTAFLYHLVVAGQKITNLRLSGETITKIFTGQITNWDNKDITRDYGRPLPSMKITVVTRADGSGASYQLSRWMWRQYPAQWQNFCARSGGPKMNCGPTEFYPNTALPGSKSLNGSDLVASYIASNPGTIGYDEYAYALDDNIPVLRVRNAAGRYTLPTAANVTTALEKATINQDPASIDFLIQNLDRVYTDTNPRAYPLSSYSYLIIPRYSRTIDGTTYGPPPIFNDLTGKTLTTWLRYALCAGQRMSPGLGYASLPGNLIKAALKELNYVPGHISPPSAQQLARCLKSA